MEFLEDVVELDMCREGDVAQARLQAVPKPMPVPICFPLLTIYINSFTISLVSSKRDRVLGVLGANCRSRVAGEVSAGTTASSQPAASQSQQKPRASQRQPETTKDKGEKTERRGRNRMDRTGGKERKRKETKGKAEGKETKKKQRK